MVQAAFKLKSSERDMNKNIEKYGDWERENKPNAFWKNTKTGEESVFHPMAQAIGGQIYKAAIKFIPTKKEQEKFKKR